MAEKTEPPTPKRIRDARKKGQFLVSREIVSVFLLGLVFTILFVGHGTLLELSVAAVTGALDSSADPSLPAFGMIVQKVVLLVAVGSGLAYAGSVIAGILGNVFQTGLVFNASKLKKGMQSLNAIKTAQQMFSKKSLFGFGMNLIKVCLIGLVVFLVIRHMLPVFLLSADCGYSCALRSGGIGLAGMFGLVAAAFIPIAVIDYLAQRHFYMKELRMTKDEVKREYKESEGDPEIKAQRKQIHQEVLNASMLNRVGKSTVVVKNPIHCAVALFYEEDETPLPLVVGKGEGALARAIVEVAEREGVPVYENVTLARALYREIDLGGFITGEFIEAVAAALNYVEETTGAEGYR